MRQADLDADAILRLAGQWEAERGELVMLDWAPHLARELGQHERADRFERDARWPTAGRVAAVFGSWNAMRAAQGRPRTRIGVSPSSRRHRRRLAQAADPAEVETGAWTLPEVLEALREDYQEHGRWPTGVDWQAADPDGLRPTTETVKHVVGRDVLGTHAPGQFSIALRLAGADPLLPGERPTDRERRNRIKALLAVDPDLPIVQIVQETGLHRSVVSRHLRWLREHGELPGPADPTDRRLARLWRANRTVAEIAEALGLTKTQVQYRRNRLDLPSRRRRVPDADQTALLELVRARRTNPEIAEALGVPLGTVTGRIAALRRSGHDLPDRRRCRDSAEEAADETAVLELLRAGKTDAEIAQALGVTHRAVVVGVGALRRSGHELPDRRRLRRQVSDAEWSTLLAMVRARKTDAEMVEALGVSRTTLVGRLNALRRSGHELPDRRRRRPQAPDPDQTALLDLVRAHKTDAEIAEALGLPLGTVEWRVRALRRAGHDLPDRRRRRSRRRRAAAADQETLIAMLRADRTDAEIAEALGVSYRAVIGRVAALRRSGHDLPDRRARRRLVPASDQDMLIAMLRADRTYAEIAGALGVPRSTIGTRVAALRQRGHDLPRRRPGPRPARS